MTSPSPTSLPVVDPRPADDVVLRVSALTKRYPLAGGWFGRGGKVLHALDGVDLALGRGEVLALVGESGSGKSTLAKIVVGSTGATSGEVHHEGSTTGGARRDDARRIQMVFQDPYSSLNPRLSVGTMLSELLRLHDIVPRAEVHDECVRLLHLVGLEEDALDAYPNQFSGGQRQRLAIARALAVRPDVLIADEPVSALDVSVQATILELFARLREELGLSILFIAHNLAVVQHLCDRVAVMYLGRIVEVADTAELFARPRHPYTRALIDSIPRMTHSNVAEEFELEGDPPSPFDLPAGCRFAPRCALAEDACRATDPALAAVDSGSPHPHLSACLRSGELSLVPLADTPTDTPTDTPHRPGAPRVKIWISLDMEGVAGIVDWDQCRPSGGPRYAVGCELMLDEVNAAIEGAIAGGATEVVLNDSHGTMANLDPRRLAGHTAYVAGRHKPLYMMQGLDETFAAAFFVGYHGSISGRPSMLSHTYNPEVFAAARVNGVEVGESGINALVAEHFGVPIAFVSGDAVTWDETEPFAPGATHVVTKESITRFSATNLHPAESCRQIREGAEQAVRSVTAGTVGTPGISRPVTLELDVQTSDMAEVATWARGAERVGERTVGISGDDLLSVFRSFVAVNYITRQAGGR